MSEPRPRWGDHAEELDQQLASVRQSDEFAATGPSDVPTHQVEQTSQGLNPQEGRAVSSRASLNQALKLIGILESMRDLLVVFAWQGLDKLEEKTTMKSAASGQGSAYE